MPQISSPTPDATVATKGKVQLAGGLRGTAASPQLAAGTAVQVVSSNYSAVATGTTLLPYDDTIPQITEGNEFMTLSITPRSATNNIVIEVNAMVSHSVQTDIGGALFQDSTANALAAMNHWQPSATGTCPIVIRHVMVAGTTSPTTFRFRAGGAAAGTITFNGAGGTRRYGGITASNMKITEVAT